MFDRDVPEIAGEDADDNIDRRGKPGLLKLTDGALERRLSADFRCHVDRAARRHRRVQEGDAAAVPRRSTASSEAEAAVRSQGVRARQPVHVRRGRAAGVPVA